MHSSRELRRRIHSVGNTSQITKARQMVAAAIELAKITTADPHAGLPDSGELGAIPGDLQLYSEDIAQLETPRKIELARETEAAALDADPSLNPVWHRATLPFRLVSAPSHSRLWAHIERCAAANPWLPAADARWAYRDIGSTLTG